MMKVSILCATAITASAVSHGTASAQSSCTTVRVAAGSDHVIALQADGTLWAWGSNVFRQLGGPTAGRTAEPVPITAPPNLVSVAAGAQHSLALDGAGDVWAWGRNDSGQCGQSTPPPVRTPARVAGLPRIEAIAAGGSFSLALSITGTVWAWGSNANGELGPGASGTGGSTPVQVTGLPAQVSSISAGWQHALAVGDGQVWGWGQNAFGQSTSSLDPLDFGPASVPLPGVAVSVAAGTAHSLARLANGETWGWGSGFNGALGSASLGSSRSPPSRLELPLSVVSLAAATDTTFAVLADGSVLALGDNRVGQAGIPGRHTAVVVAERVAIDRAARLVSSRNDHVVAILDDGSLRAWGANDEGQLGVGTIGSSLVPVVASGVPPGVVELAALYGTAFAKDADGRVWSWGENQFGQRGVGTHAPSARAEPVHVGRVAAMGGGGRRSLLAEETGRISGCGDNDSGQAVPSDPGTSLASPTPVEDASDASGHLIGQAVSTHAWYHALAVRNDGTVVGWGASGGSHVLGTTPPPLTPNVPPTPIAHDADPSGLLTNAVAVDSGSDFSMALKSDGTLWCWGSNRYGQLGSPGSPDGGNPVHVLQLAGVTRIAAGASHALALDADGRAWSWGRGGAHLGLGDSSNRNAPAPIGISPALRDISASATASLALGRDGTVWAWGDNDFGQLGDGSTAASNTPQRVIDPTDPSGYLTGVIDVAMGGQFGLALAADGTVKAWGSNLHGALGTGVLGHARAPERPLLSCVEQLPAEVPALLLGKSGHDLLFSWSSAARALRYNIYEGTLAAASLFTYDHVAHACAIPTPVSTTTGALAASGNSYYLCVGANDAGEGPYGHDSRRVMTRAAAVPCP